MMAHGGGGPKGLPRRIIFFHILPRLPVRSLQRCRSVCKRWHSFLKSRFFANLHNRHLTHGSCLQPQPSLLSLSTEKPFEFRIIDFETPDDDHGSIPQLTWTGHFYYRLAKAYSIHAVTSLHGLVCVCVEKRYWYKTGVDRDDTDLMLWNPLTGESKTLRKTNNPFSKKYYYSSSLGLYYHAADDDYKLLLISYDLDLQIYSLKSDSWRNVDHSTHNYQTLSHFGPTSPEGWVLSNGSLLNGNLYFLYSGRKLIINQKRRPPSIIKFDTKVEKFSVILTPPSLTNYSYDGRTPQLSMKVEEGRVIYLGIGWRSYSHMWRMKEDHGNWEKVGCHYKGLEPFTSGSLSEVRYTESFMPLDRSNIN